MDVVALSRVSSQLLKGFIRAASHFGQLMDVVVYIGHGSQVIEGGQSESQSTSKLLVNVGKINPYMY